jgi:hypothetical protein
VSAATFSPRREALGIALILLTAACFTAADTHHQVPRRLAAGAADPLGPLRRAGAGDGTLARGHAACRLSPARTALSAAPRQPLLATSALLFFGCNTCPLAEFTALGMLTPVFSTLLAAWLLREAVSPLRWALVGGGFAGVLIMVRPGTGIFGWAAAVPVLMAICYAGFQVLTRKLATLEDPYTTHFCTGFIGTLLLTPMLVLRAAPRSPRRCRGPAWQLLCCWRSASRHHEPPAADLRLQTGPHCHADAVHLCADRVCGHRRLAPVPSHSRPLGLESASP